jgi:hypothetical protein
MEKVAARFEPVCDMIALPVTVSSPIPEVMATPLTKGDPTFCTPPPLTEAIANSDILP